MKLNICNICNVCLALLYLVVVSFSFFLSILIRAFVRNSFILLLLSYVYTRSIDLSLLYRTGSSSGIGSGPREGSRSSLDHPLNVTQV